MGSGAGLFSTISASSSCSTVITTDCGLGDEGQPMQQTLAGMHDMRGAEHLVAGIEQIAGTALLFPIARRQMAHQPAEGFEHGQALAFLRHSKRAEHIRRHAARQRIHRLADCLIAPLQRLRGLLCLAAEAPRTGSSGNIALVALLGCSQRRQALEALCRIRFLQGRVDADPLVEDETLAA